MYKKIRRVKSVDFFVFVVRVLGCCRRIKGGVLLRCTRDREGKRRQNVLAGQLPAKVECRSQKKTCAIPKTGSHPPSSRPCRGGGKKATRSPKNGICIKVSRLQQQYYRGISLFGAFFENALPWIKKFHTRIQQLIFYMKKAPAYIINRGFYKTRLFF